MRTRLSLAVGVWLVGAGALCASPRVASFELIDRVLAVVSGTVLTLSDARAAIDLGFVEPVAGRDPVATALRYLVERELILDEVNRYAAPEPAQAAVDERLQRVRDRFATPDAFSRALAVHGLTVERVRDLIRDNMRIQVYLDQRFEGAARPTDAEVKQYYEDHKTELTRDARPLPPAEALDLATVRLQAERREALVADWVTRLRRRAEVVELYTEPAR
jgi:hypothetical protein